MDAASLDGRHKALHLHIIPDAERVVLERVELVQVQVDDLLLLSAGGVLGLGRRFRGGRGRGLLLGRAGLPGGLAPLGGLGRLASAAPAGGLLLLLGRAALALGLLPLGRGLLVLGAAATAGFLLRLLLGPLPLLAALLGWVSLRARLPLLPSIRPDGRQIDHFVLRGRGAFHAGEYHLGPLLRGGRGLRHFRRGRFRPMLCRGLLLNGNTRLLIFRHFLDLLFSSLYMKTPPIVSLGRRSIQIFRLLDEKFLANGLYVTNIISFSRGIASFDKV